MVWGNVMGWKGPNKRYYYTAQRVAGGTQYTYYGAGELATIAAAIDVHRQQQRQHQQHLLAADRQQYAALDRGLAAVGTALQRLAGAHLQAAGYHQHHRGEWRKARMHKAQQRGDELLAIVDRADRERATAADLEQLRALYDQVPEIWRTLGDLSAQAQAQLLKDALRAPKSVQEALLRKLGALRVELGGAQASPLEQLLIEQIGICWLRMQIAELSYTRAVHGGSESYTIAGAEHQARMLEATQRRYFRAIEALARVRRLLTPAQLNINLPGGQQVNIAGDVRS
jgi:hypothetical protein